jgi:hypothetical protein
MTKVKHTYFKILIIFVSIFIASCTVTVTDESEDYKIVNIVLNPEDLNLDLSGFDVFFYNHQYYTGFYGLKNDSYKKVPITIENTTVIDSSKIFFSTNIFDVKKINARYDVVYGKFHKAIHDHSIIRNDTIYNIKGFDHHVSESEFLIFDKLNAKFIPIAYGTFSYFDFININYNLVNGILYFNSGLSNNPTTINFNGEIVFGNFLQNFNASYLQIINDSRDCFFTYYDLASSQTRNKYHVSDLNLYLDLPPSGFIGKPFQSNEGTFYSLNNYNQILKIEHDNSSASVNVVYDFNLNPINGKTHLALECYIRNPIRNTTLIFGNLNQYSEHLYNYEFNPVNNTITPVNFANNNVDNYYFNQNYLFFISTNDSNDYLIKKISLQDYSEVYSAIITPALNNDYLTNRTNVYLKNNGEAYYISSSNMIFKLNILSNNNQISQIELQDHIGGFFTVLNDL